jgi:CheY-like chemotaxis protein
MDDQIAPAGAGLPGTCLVVEDDSIIRLDIEETLRGFGFSCVLGASTLEAAAQFVSTVAIRLAVLDYEIGPFNTAALAEQLLAAGVPAIFITAHGRALDLPPHLAHLQVVAKPFSSDLLAEAVRKAIEAVCQAGARSLSCPGLPG